VEAALDAMAAQITAALADRNPLLLCVMNGAVVVTGKLLPRLHFPLLLDYLHASRYQNATTGGNLLWKMRPETSLQGRVVLVVDDILDEGATLDLIVRWCEEQEAEEVYTAVMIEKLHDHKLSSLRADFVGLSAPDHYLFGYGMDYRGYWRNAEGIYCIDDADK
jgi:hypoxanthine phosphoribosyltransferase